MTSERKKRVDWNKRFGATKKPHVVVLESKFAGVPPGARMLISSPAQIAAYISTIPRGDTRTIARMRSDLARRADAAAMCPVTTAIYLRVVAECALEELAIGKGLSDVVPFWRLVAPADRLAAKLSCGAEGVQHLRCLDADSTTAVIK